MKQKIIISTNVRDELQKIWEIHNMGKNVTYLVTEFILC